MKKNLRYTAAAVSMAAMAISSVPAMAAEGDEAVTAEQAEVIEIVDEAAEEPSENEAESVGYSVLSGTINEAAYDEEQSIMRISVETEERGEIVYNENLSCLVIDGSTLKTVEDLEAGMNVSIVMKDNTPMTMSLPPQTTAVAFVINGETPSFTAVDKFDDELSSATLKLNIDEYVVIIDEMGTKKAFTAEDIKGSTAIVVYGATTRSIPAQTTPYMVVILNTDEEEIPDADDSAADEITSVPLRATLEEMGYTVSWTSHDEPIIASKDDTTVSITIGSSSIVVEGDMVFELTEEVKLLDGVTYVTSDITDVLR